MSFKGEELLPYIKQLADSANRYSTEEEIKLKQAAFRTVVSRAYYSAFLEARTHVGLEHDDSGGVHGKVQDAISRIDSTLANNLKSLKGDRTKADYRLEWEFKIQNVWNALRQAKKVIEKLKTL